MTMSSPLSSESQPLTPKSIRLFSNHLISFGAPFMFDLGLSGNLHTPSQAQIKREDGARPNGKSLVRYRSNESTKAKK